MKNVSGVLNNWHDLFSLWKSHLSFSSFFIFFFFFRYVTLINDIYEVPSQDLPVKEVKAWKVSLTVGILCGKQSRGGWKIRSSVCLFVVVVVRQCDAFLRYTQIQFWDNKFSGWDWFFFFKVYSSMLCMSLTSNCFSPFFHK